MKNKLNFKGKLSPRVKEPIYLALRTEESEYRKKRYQEYQKKDFDYFISKQKYNDFVNDDSSIIKISKRNQYNNFTRLFFKCVICLVL